MDPRALPVWKEEYEKLPVWRDTGSAQPDLALETARAQSMREREPNEAGFYERSVAPALTTAVRYPFEGAGMVDVALGVKTPEQAAERAEMYSKFIVPQTPIGAGAMAGTMAAPLLLPVRAATVLGPKVGPVLARILGGAAGGGTGGFTTGDPGMGALEGGGANVMGEALGTGGSKLLRSLPWIKGVINRMDAKRIGQAVGEISPPLAGATTPRKFQELVEERGLPALGAAKGEVVHRVEGMLPGVKGPPWTVERSPGSISMPSLGTRELPFDASKPADVLLRKANDELSRIGDMLDSVIPLDPRYQNRDLKTLYGDLYQEIARGLEARGGPAARAAWEAGQGAYRKGRAVYDVLRRSKVLEPGGVSNPLDDLEEHGMLNVVKLQRLLMDPDVAASLRKALGPLDFKKFSDAVFRGAGRGKIDRVALGGGGPFDALATIGRGQQSGAWSLPMALGRVLVPNVGAQYVGKAPLTLPSKLQAILDVALQRMGGAAMAPEARQ